MPVIELQKHLTHQPTSYDDDTFVVDTFDRREDLTVQVKLTPHGEWHRKAIGGLATACGRPLGGYGSRVEQYVGDMCKAGCFSPYELSLIPRSEETPDHHTPTLEGIAPLRKR